MVKSEQSEASFDDGNLMTCDLVYAFGSDSRGKQALIVCMRLSKILKGFAISTKRLLHKLSREH